MLIVLLGTPRSISPGRPCQYHLLVHLTTHPNQYHVFSINSKGRYPSPPTGIVHQPPPLVGSNLLLVGGRYLM